MKTMLGALILLSALNANAEVTSANLDCVSANENARLLGFQAVRENGVETVSVQIDEGNRIAEYTAKNWQGGLLSFSKEGEFLGLKPMRIQGRVVFVHLLRDSYEPGLTRLSYTIPLDNAQDVESGNLICN